MHSILSNELIYVLFGATECEASHMIVSVFHGHTADIYLYIYIKLEVQGRASRGLHFFREPIVNLGTHREPWYQNLGTKILVPRSWYQDLGTKVHDGFPGSRWVLGGSEGRAKRGPELLVDI